MEDKTITEKESLALITQMINKARDSYRDTGIGAMMWGVVIAICSLVKFSEFQFSYRLPFDIYLLTFLAVIPQIFITIREKKQRKAKSYDETFIDYLWLAFGICIFLLIFIINSIFYAMQPIFPDTQLQNHQSAFKFGEFIAPLFLILYGIPTFVTGAAYKFKPMLWGGIFCWACCLITVFSNIKIDLLLTAASAIVAWLIPGIIMQKDYRLNKMKQASMDV